MLGLSVRPVEVDRRPCCRRRRDRRGRAGPVGLGGHGVGGSAVGDRRDGRGDDRRGAAAPVAAAAAERRPPSSDEQQRRAPRGAHGRAAQRSRGARPAGGGGEAPGARSAATAPSRRGRRRRRRAARAAAARARRRRRTAAGRRRAGASRRATLEPSAGTSGRRERSACRAVDATAASSSSSSGSSSVSSCTCCSVVPSTRTREPTRHDGDRRSRGDSGWRCSTWTRRAAAPAEPLALTSRASSSSRPDDDGQGEDQPDDELDHGQPAARVVDDLGDPEAEVLVDHDDLAAGDQPAVDQQVGRAAGGAVELEDGAGGEREQVADASSGCGRARRSPPCRRRAASRGRGSAGSPAVGVPAPAGVGGRDAGSGVERRPPAAGGARRGRRRERRRRPAGRRRTAAPDSGTTVNGPPRSPTTSSRSTRRAAPTRGAERRGRGVERGLHGGGEVERRRAGCSASASTSSAPTRTAIRAGHRAAQLDARPRRRSRRRDAEVAGHRGARRSAARPRAARRGGRRGGGERRACVGAAAGRGVGRDGGHRFSSGGAATIERGEPRAAGVPGVAWAKVMSSTVTSRGADAGWASRSTSPTARPPRSSGPRRVGRKRDRDVDRHLAGTARCSIGGAGALRALALGDGRGGRRLTRWGSRPLKGRQMRHPVGAVADPEVEGRHDHHVGGAGDLGELGAVLDAGELGVERDDAGQASSASRRAAARRGRGRRRSRSRSAAASGCSARPGPPSMWSTHDIMAGSGISRTPSPGIGSAENISHVRRRVERVDVLGVGCAASIDEQRAPGRRCAATT